MVYAITRLEPVHVNLFFHHTIGLKYGAIGMGKIAVSFYLGVVLSSITAGGSFGV